MTKKIWYYELPLPLGLKQYTKNTPIQHNEFEPVKRWWKNRKTSPFSWQVSINDIKENNCNLDIKNPHIRKEHYIEPEILEEEYLSLKAKNKKLLDKIKQDIEKALL